MAEVKKEACEISQAMKSKGWIKNILVACILIVILAIIVSAFGGSSLLSGGYSKTFELETTSLSDQELCGVQPGKHEFKMYRTVEVIVGNEMSDITSFVRVNKTLPGEAFEAPRNGCVTVSFSVATTAKKLVFPRQILAITIK